MKKVSQLFKDSVKGVTKREIRSKIEFHMTDPVGEHALVCSPTIGFEEQLFDEKTSAPNWATLEPGRFKLDGSMQIPAYSNSKEYGYVSSVMSDASGDINIDLQINFTESYTSSGFTIIFQEPVLDFKIIASGITHTIADNEDLKCFIPHEEAFDSVKIKVTKLHPNRRVRILELFIGQILEYDDSNILDVSLINEIDLLNERLPSDSIDLTLDNSNRKFDLLNPAGIYKYLKQNQVVKPYFGVVINNTIEYVQCGKYYLKDWSTQSIQAEFEAYSFMDVLEDEVYRTGVVRQKNLYTLISELLTGIDCEIDKSLARIETSGYIGLVSKREAFRLMLQAGNCLAFSDETGKIIVKRHEDIKNRNSYLTHAGEYIAGQVNIERSSESKNNHISADDMYSWPTVSQVKPYASAKIAVYSFSADTQVQTLYKGNVDTTGADIISGKYRVWVEYSNSPATEISVSGVNQYEAYANGCYVYVNSNASITITGKVVYQSIREFTKKKSNFDNQCIVNNPLIISTENASAVADYILNGYDLTANVDYRGYIYPDTGDQVSIETEYGDNPFFITRQTLDYDGTLSGTMEGVGRSE